MSAYRENQLEISSGDQVRLNANNYAQGYINGDRATVVSIDNDRQSIALQKTDGTMLQLDMTKPLHLEHGYCSTVHSAQGQTADRVLIEADTRSATSNESLYYVAISRARYEVQIFTDDKALLPQAMAREDAKSAALDVQQPKHEMSMG